MHSMMENQINNNKYSYSEATAGSSIVKMTSMMMHVSDCVDKLQSYDKYLETITTMMYKERKSVKEKEGHHIIARKRHSLACLFKKA